MVNLDRERIYSRYDLEKEKPSNYRILEKNYKHPKISQRRDRYKIVDIIEDVGLYERITPYSNDVSDYDGLIVVEMVNPESE